MDRLGTGQDDGGIWGGGESGVIVELELLYIEKEHKSYFYGNGRSLAEMKKCKVNNMKNYLLKSTFK